MLKSVLLFKLKVLSCLCVAFMLPWFVPASFGHECDTCLVI